MLEKINKSNDIKKLSIEEKKILAEEIRKYLVTITSKNGGHLASNLGVVELTIALESVFDVTKDKIVWDVGHQCYVHKILNGRKESMNNIRQYGGIAGFPKTNESPTDTFNTGHSSTSISAAMGIATARDLKKKEYNVIAVIGDGALTGGMALEAMNHVGYTQTRMIIILNDNEMSISKNISGMNNLLTKLRSKKNYRRTNSKGKQIISSIPAVGKIITEVVSKSKNAVKQVFIPGMYFEDIGIKYLGPVDGHNLSDLESILSKAKNFDEPVLIHVLTKKGKGYLPAEENPDKFHGVSAFSIDTGKPIKPKIEDFSTHFGHTLTKLAQKNKNIVAITAAMKDGTGLTEFANKYPDRFFDVGIAEQHALTFAAGLATSGMIPVVSIYSSFYQRCYDQIIHDICLQNLHVIMCIDRAGIVGNDGPTHHGMFDLSFLKPIPNLIITAPRDFIELDMILEYAINTGKPIAIRYPRGGEFSNNLPHSKIIEGKAEIIEDGTNLSIITIGNSFQKGIELSNRLKEHNINTNLINIRFLKPFDKKTVVKSINKTKKVIVIEDGSIIGGLSSTIKELIEQEKLSVEAKYFAYPDKFIEHGSISDIENKYNMDINSIEKIALKLFETNKYK